MRFRLDFWNRFKRRAQPEDAPHREIFGYRFRNPDLLREALTHRSYANSNGTDLTYERLEFLGDSVLGVIVARYLFNKHEAFSEGELTKAKAALVNIKALTQVARKEGLGKYILLSPEEERAGGRNRPSILSDVLEAVIGAIYLDGGIVAASNVIDQVLIQRFANVDTRLLSVNHKGDLLEMMQGEGHGLPRYEVVSETGPDHEKVFTVAVHTNGREVGRGVGSNKKDAEQNAAREALRVLKRERKAARSETSQTSQ
ncbi:MAG: ribonuclease III [candidate division Zixibacteria bacterium]|nr:ribonuclease III [candidate division Zixibacteria bacterium]